MGTAKERSQQKELPFAESARSVLEGAKRLAEYGDRNIGLQHLYASVEIELVREDPDLCREVINSHMHPSSFYTKMNEFDPQNPQQRKTPHWQPSLTDAAKKALALTAEDAKLSGATEVLPSHILRGIVRYVAHTLKQHDAPTIELAPGIIDIPKAKMENFEKKKPLQY